ncbi:MAG: hypothetical protein AAF089_10455 [Bacteroidota bacterium]
MSPLLRRLFLFSLFLAFGSLALIIVDLALGVQVPVVRRYLPYGLAVGMLVMLTVYVGHFGKPDDPRKRGEATDDDTTRDEDGATPDDATRDA